MMLTDVWSWVQANWIGVYIIGGLITAALAALAFFVGVWWFAAYKYALSGLAVGWVPGGVAGVVAAVVCGFLWPLIVPLVLGGGSLLIEAIDRGEI